MKTFIALLVVLSPVLGWTHENHSPVSDIINKSPVSLATVAALTDFHDANLGAVWGWNSQLAQDDVTSNILHIDSTAAAAVAKYDCHFHSHGSENEAHCHNEGVASSSLAAPSSVHFSTEDLVTALTSALDIFNRKVSAVENLTAIKTWQSAEQIFVHLNYQAGTSNGVSYYMCHIHHGAEIDCHRSLNPGPQEPVF
ncbi:hypothetical protein AZI86_03695 [Bdellovibrio bacteriovorus]|uniref:Uncharacterized protein n=1 Tax=Bdellovibrio bacteriovorus TaxID=959 RepID=A0A150WPC0_BDEBC|nr:hypothetical protein [Bdellovibrio bacteriovorus]KYG66174.1 hypothetical protein AZI86_03695 [Bdellovibrio bacteriovorus]